MKSMTCRQLGGACDQEFRAATFDEMARLSRDHAMAMFQKGDQPHVQAMESMRQTMSSPDAMGKWMAEKKAEFDGLPEV